LSMILIAGYFAVLFTAIGRLYGEDIALGLQKTPTTTLGWRFIGWLVSAPPFVLAIISWHERHRLRPEQRRDRTYLLAGWIGLSMFVLPARTTSIDSQFGTGALVGDPLSEGWAWGAVASVLAQTSQTTLRGHLPTLPAGATLLPVSQATGVRRLPSS